MAIESSPDWMVGGQARRLTCASDGIEKIPQHFEKSLPYRFQDGSTIDWVCRFSAVYNVVRAVVRSFCRWQIIHRALAPKTKLAKVALSAQHAIEQSL